MTRIGSSPASASAGMSIMNTSPCSASTYEPRASHSFTTDATSFGLVGSLILRSPDCVPEHLIPAFAEHRLGRRLLVDVADEAGVDAVADELLQPRRERLDQRRRQPEVLVLLLADVAGAVVHGDADALLVGRVGTAAMPQRAVP